VLGGGSTPPPPPINSIFGSSFCVGRRSLCGASDTKRVFDHVACVQSLTTVPCAVVERNSWLSVRAMVRPGGRLQRDGD
jgi:hypothetical protein